MHSSIFQIVQKLVEATKRPYLVGIDGQSGAGKSTLCARLHRELPDVIVIHNDDFYRVMDDAIRESFHAEQGYDLYFDWQRLEQQVLLPLNNRDVARYHRYDWVKQELTETIEVDAANKIVIVEGVGSTRPELRKYYDLRIWVDTSEAERLRRQIARGENPNEWIQRWAAAENYYVENFGPSGSADVLIAGE